jgi:hypothetical protein
MGKDTIESQNCSETATKKKTTGQIESSLVFENVKLDNYYYFILYYY